MQRYECDHENYLMYEDERFGGWVKYKDVEPLENLLIKIRDCGQFFNSAIELEFNEDGEEILSQIEDLVGVKSYETERDDK